jgi:hypothetical protein
MTHRFSNHIFAVLVIPLLGLAGCSSSGGPDMDVVTQPGVLASMQIVSGNNQSAAAGTELPNPLVGKLIDAAGHVSSTPTFSDSHGLVQVRWTLGPGAGIQKVDVRDVSDTGSGIIYATFQATASAGVAASATPVAGTNGQAAGKSNPLPMPISVSVVDIEGNVKAGVNVTFVPCATCGTVSPASAVTNAGGIASSTWVLGTSDGTQELTAHIAGLPDVRFQAIATGARSATGSAAFSLVALEGDTQTIDQHQRNLQALRVFVSDASGRGVPGVAVDFSPAEGSAFFEPQTVNADADGFADFSTYFHQAGALRVEAAVARLPSVIFDLNVTPNVFEFDGSYECRSADRLNAPFAMLVKESAISDGHRTLTGDTVSVDGSLKALFEDSDRELQGAIMLDGDGGATARGTSITGASRSAWTCERR